MREEKQEKKPNIFVFKQRCLKCGGVKAIPIEQKFDKPLKKPENYTCGQCGHKGVFGEAPILPKPISYLSVAESQLPPVLDENGNASLIVDNKRVPLTLGRILLLKKDISAKMAQLDSLEATWKKENEVK